MKDIKSKSHAMHHAKLKSWGHKGEVPDRVGKIKSACGGKVAKRADGGRIHKDIGGPLDGLDGDGPMDSAAIEGGPAKPRADRRSARGPATITLNINTSPAQPPAPPMPPPPLAGPPPPPPGGMPPPAMMPPPGGPPPMMPRADGGRTGKASHEDDRHHDLRRDDLHDRPTTSFGQRNEGAHHDFRRGDRHEIDNHGHVPGKDFGGGLTGGGPKMIRALPPQVAAHIPPRPTLPHGLGAPHLGFGLRAAGGRATKDHDEGHAVMDEGGVSGTLEKAGSRNPRGRP